MIKFRVILTLCKGLLLYAVLCYINDLVVSNSVIKSWRELFSRVLVHMKQHN
jgi:hypothetical protein